MNNFSLTDKAKGAGMWGLIMGMAGAMIYLPLLPPEGRAALFTLFFPVILAMISNTKYFYVNMNVIISAGMIACVSTLLLGLIKDVKRAQEQPLLNSKNIARSAAVQSATISIFMISILLVSNFSQMYDYKNTI